MSNTPILIVEDDPASSDILTQLLVHNQLAVDVAQSGEEALEHFARKEYALAIIDLALPGINGWELLDIVQADPGSAATQKVALTAYYDPALARQAREAGFRACFPKPATQALIDNLLSFIDNPGQG